jgi:hypothetical protein
MALQDLKPVRWLVGMARNSPWILIAVGLHVILAAAMSVMYMHRELQKQAESATQIAVTATRAPVQEVVQPPEEIDRKKIPENEVVSELVTYQEETTFVPTEETPAEVDYHDDIGDPTGSDDGSEGFTGGTSIGVGQGGHYGTGVPSNFVGRRIAATNLGKEGRLPRGPLQGTEEAVLEGLRWLARHQNDDGSWSAADLHAHCTTDPACIPADAALDRSYDVGMTALALLAFLGQGISVGSKIAIVDTAMGVEHQAGEVVKRGIRWLMAQQKEDGSFSDSAPFERPENDTLPTMALCEAYGLSPTNREIRRLAQDAVDHLVAAQKRTPDGERWGWGIGSQADLERRRDAGEITPEEFDAESAQVDPAISCWAVMALYSARVSGFDVPPESLAGALAYGVAATGTDDGASDAARDPDDRFSYHVARRAALGMLLCTFAGGEISDPHLARAAADIAADVPHVTKDGLSVDFYYWYFATLALNQYDGPDSPRAGSGKFWEPWNEGLVESLPPLQDRTRKADVCARGGWLQEARGNARGGALYNTALNVLTLEVYYRFDNVFGAAAK